MILKDSKFNVIDVTFTELMAQIEGQGFITIFGFEGKAITTLIEEYYRISGKKNIITQDVKDILGKIPSTPKKKIQLLKLADFNELDPNKTYVVNNKLAKLFKLRSNPFIYYLKDENNKDINIKQNKVYEIIEVDEDQVTPEFIKGLQ